MLTLGSLFCRLLTETSPESSLFFREREAEREVEDEFMDRNNGRMGETSREETAELDEEWVGSSEGCFDVPLTVSFP